MESDSVKELYITMSLGLFHHIKSDNTYPLPGFSHKYLSFGHFSHKDTVCLIACATNRTQLQGFRTKTTLLIIPRQKIETVIRSFVHMKHGRSILLPQCY